MGKDDDDSAEHLEVKVGRYQCVRKMLQLKAPFLILPRNVKHPTSLRLFLCFCQGHILAAFELEKQKGRRHKK